MSAAQDPPHTLPRGKLLLATGGATVAGALIVFGAITPAEFNFDPLGIGKLSGVVRLWAPKDVQGAAKGELMAHAHAYAQTWRTDVIEIPLSGFLGGYKNSDLEYKVRMAKDAALIFDWEVVGASDPREFHYDFHGHTLEEKPGSGMTVVDYRQGFGLTGHGSLIAPFDGIDGWMFQNSSEKPVIVRVRLSGFYDLIPNGQPGNTSNVTANVPAAQARPELPANLAPTFTANSKGPAT